MSACDTICVGIKSIKNNSDGSITIYLTDGSSITTPVLTGPAGPTGAKGTPGVNSGGIISNDTALTPTTIETIQVLKTTSTTFSDARKNLVTPGDMLKAYGRVYRSGAGDMMSGGLYLNGTIIAGFQFNAANEGYIDVEAEITMLSNVLASVVWKTKTSTFPIPIIGILGEVEEFASARFAVAMNNTTTTNNFVTLAAVAGASGETITADLLRLEIVKIIV